MTQEEKYMKEAIKQAKKAAAIGDVPIGCVIVEDDKIIARAYNQRNKKKTTLAQNGKTCQLYLLFTKGKRNRKKNRMRKR